MKREATGTLWVLVTLVTVFFALCTAACVIGLVTYEITGSAQ